jgi:O-antigen/teichoic acid export membrane protein
LNIQLASKKSKSEFTHNVKWVAIGQTVARTAQILVTLLFVYLLVPSAWNELAVALSLFLVGVTVGSLNLEHSILFFLPRRPQEEWGALLSTTMKMLFITGGVTGLVISLSGILLLDANMKVPLLLVGIAVCLEIPTVIVGPTLIALNKSHKSGQWDLFQALFQFALVSLPAFVIGTSNSILLGLIGASAFRLASALFIMYAIGARMRHKFSLLLVVQQIRFCLPLGVALAAGVLTRSIDKWLVAIFAFQQVGMYAVAAIEIPLLAVLPYAGGAAIASDLTAAFMRGDIKGAHHIWLQQLEKMIIPVIYCTVGIVLVAPELFEILLPTRYMAVIVPFQIFTFIAVHRVTEYGLVLRAANRSELVTQSSLVLLGSNVVLAGLGLMAFGLSGMAMGSLMAFAIAWVWMLKKLAGIFDIHMREVFAWSRWAVTLLAACTTAVSAVLLTHGLTDTPLRVVAKLAALGVGGYVFVKLQGQGAFSKKVLIS